MTDKVRAARKDGMSDADANVAMKTKMGELEKACSDKNEVAISRRLRAARS